MPVTNYISVNGRMLSEVTDGVILDYVPDALGSIHSVVDQTATAVKTMRYKPYGEVLSRSGGISDRMYQWVGTYGYRATFNYASSHYVRARHYSQTPGSWTTVDPLWPDQSGYGYSNAQVTSVQDASGSFPYKGRVTCDTHFNTLVPSKVCGKSTGARPVAADNIGGKMYSACNLSPENGLCPVYAMGMTGSWRKLTAKCDEKKDCDCNPPRVDRCRYDKYPGAESQSVPVVRIKCGDVLRVCVTEKVKGSLKSACVSVKIIDQGPSSRGNARDKLMDLHLPPMNSLRKQLGLKPWTERDCKTFAQFSEAQVTRS